MNSKSDQFDIRINLVSPTHLTDLLKLTKTLYDAGGIKYVHVSGVEIGTNEKYTSCGQKHVHIALILNNYTSRGSIIRKFVKEKGGWYVEARDKSRSITGWIEYHKKRDTKIGPENLLIQLGVKPVGRAVKVYSDDKRVLWGRKKDLMRAQDWEKLDDEFPGFLYSSSGQIMKREIIKLINDKHNTTLALLDNYIIWGGTGTGKSSSVAKLYPNCYRKQKGTQFWDGYDRCNPDHKVVWIDEMSKETLATLTGKAAGGFEFLKELGDRYAVTVDAKYVGAFKIRPTNIIITMNEHPHTLLPDRGYQVNALALERKFNILHVNDWLVKMGMKNTPQGAMFLGFDDLSISEIEHELIYNSANHGSSETKSDLGTKKRSAEDDKQDNREKKRNQSPLSRLLCGDREDGEISS